MNKIILFALFGVAIISAPIMNYVNVTAGIAMLFGAGVPLVIYYERRFNG